MAMYFLLCRDHLMLQFTIILITHALHIREEKRRFALTFKHLLHDKQVTFWVNIALELRTMMLG